MNPTAYHRSLQSLLNVSYRHVRTTAPRPLPRGYAPPTSLCHPFSSKAYTPSLLLAVESLHIRKKRRYSSQAASQVRHDTERWIERDPPREGRAKLATRRIDTSSAGRFARNEDREGQEGDGGIIITSNRQNFRDKQGRPWTKGTSSEGQGEGAGALGVSVGVPAVPKRKRKPRMQLRDLAVKPTRKTLEPWQVQKGALENKFGDEGWNPRKKLSPDAMEGIRALHEEDSERWPTPVLAEHFKVSPEAVRRILKSKWKPKDDVEVQKRRERWARRHDRIWDHQAELGLRSPRQKDRDVEGPDTFDEELRAKEMLDLARRA